ncbi:tyrosine-type recombinase/integrase [Mangrovimonas sp. TPBH4]|uniref:tyrosine-type recombinase/integrase n=1 Tax=Mangrovimonas sp. TPBH4 TaxID=1645914 RepID=UPI0006B4DB6B|nr:tyrosine-type recombinase/integrase [Mangrovimonas sp. TPBH4]
MSVTAFTNYLLYEKKYAMLTIKAYSKDLDDFQEFIALEHEGQTLQNLEYRQIRTWIVSLVEQGMSNRSINRKVSSLNSYYKFMVKIGDMESNPLAKHKALKATKKVQVPFSEEEMENVIKDLKSETDFEGIRDRLVIELFYATGVRRIELVQLKLVDLDLANKTLKVLGKRNKERIIPLIDTVVQTAKEYLELRSSLEIIKDNEFLFLTKKGVKIYETLVYRIINDYFSRASTKVKRSPHILRHSFATHLLSQGANMNAVKELLGHSSLAATQVYTHNSINELKKVYSNAHPRSKKRE